MDHERASELLAAYLDNELTAEERAQVETHLENCRDCQRELDELRTMQDALRQGLKSMASDATPPAAAWSEIQHEIDIQRPSFLFLFRRRKWRILATVIVVAILVTLGALWLTGVLPGLR